MPDAQLTLKSKKWVVRQKIARRRIASLAPYKNKRKIHSLTLGSFYGAASYIATDQTSGAQEKLASDIGIGLSATWTHHWTEDFNYFFVGSIKKFNFKTSPNRELRESSLTKSYVGTGVSTRLNERILVSSVFSLAQTFLLTSDGTSKLDIIKLEIPTISLGLSLDLIKFDSGFNLTSQLTVGGLLPVNQNGVDTNFGQYQSVELNSNFDLLEQNLNISSFFTQRKLRSLSLEQKSKELGFKIGIGWIF